MTEETAHILGVLMIVGPILLIFLAMIAMSIKEEYDNGTLKKSASDGGVALLVIALIIGWLSVAYSLTEYKADSQPQQVEQEDGK